MAKHAILLKIYQCLKVNNVSIAKLLKLALKNRKQKVYPTGIWASTQENLSLEGLWTTKAQTSLRIRADWSAPLLFDFWKDNISTHAFNVLASLCSWGYWFESHFHVNPEDRFCREEAHVWRRKWIGRHEHLNFYFLIMWTLLQSTRKFSTEEINCFQPNKSNNSEKFYTRFENNGDSDQLASSEAS